MQIHTLNRRINNTLENERLFHNRRFVGNDRARAKLSKYYSINGTLKNYYHEKILEVCNGSELLEYGCGTGEMAFQWTKQGAKVTGIDISDKGIKKARDRARNEGVDVEFYQMDAENMCGFNDNSFDIVTGKSILHHLNLEKAYKEIARVLRNNGRAIFIEPLGHNIFIIIYRRLTPSLRTRNEHPLKLEDLKAAEKYFGEVKITYYHIFTLLAVPFRNRFFFNDLLKTLTTIDENLMTLFPRIKRYAWTAVIELHNPLPWV